LQAIKAEVDTPEYAEAMRQLSVAESLDVIVRKGIERQHQQRFLAPLQQIMDEYQNTSNILETLANDLRFRLDLNQIKNRAESEPNGLSGWLPAIDIDARDNPRQEMSPEESVEYRNTLQALDEIQEAVINVMYYGMSSGAITRETIVAQAEKSRLNYDWSIFNVGIER